MFLLNLSAPELFVLLGTAIGFVATLYLLDRSRRKRTVSTLQFWAATALASREHNRYRVREPWSLLLQVLAITLLLLAIAGLQWGRRSDEPRNHVVLLDTSSLTAQRHGDGTVLDEEKTLVREYLRRLSSNDRVMLVDAAGFVMPLTAFTSDRRDLFTHLANATTSYTALRIDVALTFARQVQTWPAGRSGEIVYVGPQEALENNPPQIANLRVLPVRPSAANCGITQLRAQQLPEANRWAATVSIRNYGSAPKPVQLRVRFGTTEFAPRPLLLEAGEETHVEYEFVASSAGELRAQLVPGDSFPMDDVATVLLPQNRSLRVAVFTKRTNEWEPMLGANSRLNVHYQPPSEYREDTWADVVILDQFAPSARPIAPSLWVHPPQAHSPLPVLREVQQVQIDSWSRNEELGRGLHSRDLRVPVTYAYRTLPGNTTVASAAGQSLVVVSPGSAPRGTMAVIGFDPLSPTLRYQITSPLLVANLLQWLTPAVLRPKTINCDQVGLQTVALNNAESAGPLRVMSDGGVDIPFTSRDKLLQFFVPRPAHVKVVSTEQTHFLSVDLPQVPLFVWKAPGAVIGLPPLSQTSASFLSLWRYLTVAALLLLLIEWALFVKRPTWSRLTLKLTAAVIAAIALFAPELSFPQSHIGVVVLIDTSASIGGDDLQRASQTLREIAAYRGSNWLSVVPFAGTPHHLPDSDKSNLHLVRAAYHDESATDVETALTEGLASVPASYMPRVLLLSDGNENEGSAARAMVAMQRMHVPVDVIPMSGRSLGDLAVTSVAMPDQAYAGAFIPVTLTIESPRADRGTLRLEAEGKTLGTQRVDLHAGTNVVTAHIRVKSSGAVVISGVIETAASAAARFDRSVQLKVARVLYLSQDAPGTETNLLAAFKSAEFEVIQDTTLLDGALFDPKSNIQLVLLNNVDLNTLPLSQKKTLEMYVSAGGGLLLIGGEHQVYKEDRQMDVLDDVLPAKLAPPRNPEGICVALIIDKSSSMEGRKIDLARLSAVGVVDHLQSKDTIGVLIFDNSYEWAVPMEKAQDKEAIKNLISGITPDGGTQIAPALSEAYRKVIRSNSTYKHIVLMTDGISEEGDSLDLAKEALAHQVTISTVGLGQDVNRSYLEKIAALSGGKSYFLNNPQGLEQILLKDVQDYSGTTAVEKPLTPMVKQKAELLDGVDMGNAPALKGYVRYEAKPGAETLLTIDAEKHDPLLVRWQYGLGRVAVWTSDAKSRWAEGWMNWPGFDKFWINTSRDLLSHTDTTEVHANFDAANSTLQVTYRLPRNADLPGKPESVYVLGPQRFAREITLQRTGPQLYQGQVHVDRQTGFFRIRPVSESWLFPEIGFYRTEEEFLEHGVNQQLLRELASATGGRYDPAPASVFNFDGRTLISKIAIWPLLLAIVIVLTLAEITARKWNGLPALLRRKLH